MKEIGKIEAGMIIEEGMESGKEKGGIDALKDERKAAIEEAGVEEEGLV